MPSNRHPLLLIAEDDDDLREVATGWLASAGFDVRTARHGQDAINALEHGAPPSVIVLDLMMPIVSGWDVWDWLQASRHKDVPVVVWTATGLRQGAVGKARVVQKGTDPRELLHALREALGIDQNAAIAP